MSRRRSRARSQSRGRDLSRRSLLLGLVAGGAGALALPPVLGGRPRTPTFQSGTNNPAVDRASGGTAAVVAADGFRIARTDVRFMNRIVRERTHEMAYCGLVDGRRLQPWLADTVSADESAATFTVDNCPGDADDLRGTIHTHPDGRPVLSSTDVATLRETDREFMCVQSRPVSTLVGDSPDHLRCYRLVAGSPEAQIRSIPLEVATADGSGGRIMAP